MNTIHSTTSDRHSRRRKALRKNAKLSVPYLFEITFFSFACPFSFPHIEDTSSEFGIVHVGEMFCGLRVFAYVYHLIHNVVFTDGMESK